MHVCMGYSVFVRTYITCITDIITIIYYIVSSSPKLLFFYSFCSIHQQFLLSDYLLATGDSKAILERLLSFKLLLKRVLISFICEKLLSTEAVVTGRQIAPILLKLGNRVFNMSLEASSFNCAFISFLGLLTNRLLLLMVYFGKYSS